MILLWVGLFLSVFGLEFKDQTMDKPNLARFMLPPDKDYMDWWKLTPENYNERVLESVDAWIVAIHPKNQQPEVWRKMAPRYRGQIFFGKLQDDVINEDMKKKYKYDGRPILIAYRWTRKKKSEFFSTDDMRKALEYSIESLPVKNLNQISFDDENDETHVNQFILRSYYKNDMKPRFPVIFVYDYDKMGGVSPLFRVASHYFSEFFNFGLVEYKDVEKLRSTFQSYPKPSESDLPQAVTLIGQEPSDEEFASGDASLSFNIVIMNKMKFGEMNFNTLVGYLFWINTEFRSTLPGKPPKEDILVETMGSVRNKLWQRLEALKPAAMKSSRTATEGKLLQDYEKLKNEAKEKMQETEKKIENIKSDIDQKNTADDKTAKTEL